MHADTLAHIRNAPIFAEFGVAEASDLAEVLEDSVFVRSSRRARPATASM